MKYTFSKPYEFEGQTYEEIEFDIENLRGSDISAVKKTYAATGNFNVMPITDDAFCCLILERVAKKPLDFFMNLPANDYVKLTMQVSSFLMG